MLDRALNPKVNLFKLLRNDYKSFILLGRIHDFAWLDDNNYEHVNGKGQLKQCFILMAWMNLLQYVITYLCYLY